MSASVPDQTVRPIARSLRGRAEGQRSVRNSELGLIARAKTIDESGGSLIRFVHELCNDEKEP